MLEHFTNLDIHLIKANYYICVLIFISKSLGIYYIYIYLYARKFKHACTYYKPTYKNKDYYNLKLKKKGFEQNLN